MIGAATRVLRAEGWASATRRAAERVTEALQRQRLLARGRGTPIPPAELVNACGLPVVARLGGLPIQLRARLAVEREWRSVALWQPGWLSVDGRAWRAPDLLATLAACGAERVHLEGTSGLPLAALAATRLRLVLGLHDLALLDEPAALRDALFARAERVVYASAFLRDAYGVDGDVVEPASPARAAAKPANPDRRRVAIVGSIKPHKGGALLPALVEAVAADWHVFGGGDAELLAPLAGHPRVHLHGYHRAGTLPARLVAARIAVAVAPSIVPEGYGLVLSECWSAGVPVVAFAHGALGQRIAQQGGGWTVTPSEGAQGLAKAVSAALAGSTRMPVPAQVPSARDAASAMRALYARLGCCLAAEDSHTHPSVR